MTAKWITPLLSRFLRAETGSATVEFTLWVPAFIGIMLLGLDASTSFTRQSNLWSVSYETARIVSRHAMDAEAGEAYARARMRVGGYTPDVNVTIDESSQVVTVAVTVAPSEMAPFGILAMALKDEISLSVTEVLEPL